MGFVRLNMSATGLGPIFDTALLIQIARPFLFLAKFGVLGNGALACSGGTNGSHTGWAIGGAMTDQHFENRRSFDKLRDAASQTLSHVGDKARSAGHEAKRAEADTASR